MGAADVVVGYLCGVEEYFGVLSAFFFIEAAFEEGAAERFTAKYVLEGECLEVGVFECFYLFSENNAFKVFVAIK